MAIPLRILILEDRPEDAELMAQELRKAGFIPHWQRCDNMADFLAGLNSEPEVVLSDFTLPQCDAMNALRLCREMRPDVPFIVVSGMIGEAQAVAAIKEGATDFVGKDRLDRLGPSVTRSLEECRLRRESREMTEKLKLHATILAAAANAIVITDVNGNVEWANPAFTTFTGYKLDDVLGRNLRILKSGKHDAAVYAQLWQTINAGDVWTGELINRRKDGSLYHERQTISPVRNEKGSITRFVAIKEDITERKMREDEKKEQLQLYSVNADVRAALASRDNLRVMLHQCATSLVTHLDAAFARIWTHNPATNELELQASAGQYTHLNGPHSRILVGKYKIGLIAQELKPQLTNDVQHDPRISDPDWAKREGMVAFAGYPLKQQNRLVGVMALFARHSLSESVFRVLESVADHIALGIENARADHALRESEERLRLILDSTAEAIYGIDSDGNCILANPACVRAVGFSEDQLRGRNMHALIHHTRADGTPYPIEECPVNLTCREWIGAHVDDEVFWRADGSSFPAEYWSYPIYRGEQVVGAVTAFLDISERKRLEQQIRESQRRLEHIVATSPSVLFTLGGEGRDLRPTWVSGNIQDMTGYTLKEVFEPHWWFNGIHSEDAERVMDKVANKLYATGYVSDEFRFRFHDGTYRWVRHELRLVKDEAGRPLEVVGSWSNVHEQKLLEEQLRQSSKLDAIGQLAGGIAHDFNNIMTGIIGYSRYLRRENLSDRGHEDIQKIIDLADRAASLTHQLLAFSRRQTMQLLPTDLSHVAREFSKMLTRILGEQIEIELKLDPSAGLVVADPAQIEQVIMNLAVNARDAMMPDGGKLTIEVRPTELDAEYVRQHAPVSPGSYVMLAVSDTGCGMDTRTQQRIFEPFFTTKETGKGTGLGLATVYGIVKQHGGYIWVYSEVGKGTTFKIYLPVVERAVAVERPAPDDATTPHGSEMILLVEDELSVREITERILTDAGYRVVAATCPDEAELIWQECRGQIDLLLTDDVMPGCNGVDLFERLHAEQPSLRVIFMSGYAADHNTNRRLKEIGAPFLEKPFSQANLLSILRRILGRNASGAGQPQSAPASELRDSHPRETHHD